MTLAFQLPWPPTVNTYYRSVMMPVKKGSGIKAPRVLISERGRLYRIAVGAKLAEQRVPKNAIDGRLAVHIAAIPPDRRERDLDNLFKGLLDSLKHHGVIRDDADIDKLSIERGFVQAPGGVIIRIEQLQTSAHQAELVLQQKPAEAPPF